MSTPKPEEWGEIWRLPQAVMWEGMGAEPIVARYVDLRQKVMDSGFPEARNASFWNVLMALEDRLGLTPTAMMKLQWEIEGAGDRYDDPLPGDGRHAPGTVSRMDEVKKRLKGGS